MLIILHRGATPAQVEGVVDAVRSRGLVPHPVESGAWKVVLAAPPPEESHPPSSGGIDPAALLRLDGVVRVLPFQVPWVRAAGEPGRPRRRFLVGDIEIGGDEPVLAAGPCAVESPEQILEAAHAVRDAGARILRGGCYKFRTSPYTFQGMGREGLQALREAGVTAGLAVVTECLDPRDVGLIAEVADMIQIGARSMQNLPLLREAARAGRPILLKRGPGATLEEWLLAAEHVMNAGEERIVLCERGIRTFSTHSRYTLDLSIVPRLREETILPVWVDPSHATGRSGSVAAMARAGLAAGADGLLIEVHPRPAEALSDGSQAITPTELSQLVTELHAMASMLAAVTP